MHREDQGVEIEFKQGEKRIYDVCEDIVKAIEYEVPYELIPESFQRHYGLTGEETSRWMVLGRMTSQQFIHSLFLVFLHRSSAAAQEERPAKYARPPEPSIAMARSAIDAGGVRYIRMKIVVRFYTITREPIEIHLESKHNLS